MEIRNIQQTRGSIYIVSLPKEQADHMGQRYECRDYYPTLRQSAYFT